jgi:hypothetical protein
MNESRNEKPKLGGAVKTAAEAVQHKPNTLASQSQQVIWSEGSEVVSWEWRTAMRSVNVLLMRSDPDGQ